MRISFSYKFSKSSLVYDSSCQSFWILLEKTLSHTCWQAQHCLTSGRMTRYTCCLIACLFVEEGKGKRCKRKGNRYKVCALCQVLILHATACILYHLIFSVSHKIDSLMTPILGKGAHSLTRICFSASLPFPTYPRSSSALLGASNEFYPTWKSGSTESDLSACV